MNDASEHETRGFEKFNFTREDLDYFDGFDDEVDRPVYDHALRLFEDEVERYGITRDACIERGCWPKVGSEQDVKAVEAAKAAGGRWGASGRR